MGFLFRKYNVEQPEEDVSQTAPSPVETEDVPSHPAPEFRLFPPSPKAQIVLIATGFFLLNAVLIAIWAIVLYNNR